MEVLNEVSIEFQETKEYRKEMLEKKSEQKIRTEMF